jgi:hypothetical protein
MTPLHFLEYCYRPVGLDDIFLWQIQCNQQQASNMNLDKSFFFFFKVRMTCTELMWGKTIEEEQDHKKLYARESVPRVNSTVTFFVLPGLGTQTYEMVHV